MITKDTTLHEIAERYPEALRRLAGSGFPALGQKDNLQRIGASITLAMAANMKGLDPELLAAQLNEAIDSESGSPRRDPEDLWLAGMLPCPVRLPLSESINDVAERVSRARGVAVKSEFQAAYAGTDWIARHIREGMGISDFPDLLLAAGYRLFFTDPTVLGFRNSAAFRGYTEWREPNRCAREAGLADPEGHYTVIGSVPAIILANPEVLGERPVPASWEEILSPRYEGMLSVPLGDFDLFDGLVLTLFSRFGYEGIDALRRNLFKAMHPSEVVASEGSLSQPGLAVVPYFFASTLRQESNYIPVWPREGAFAAPLFMLTRDDRPQIEELARYVAGEEIGKILWGMGRFPSTHPAVEPDLPGPLLWPGWDFLMEQDLTLILNHAEATLAGTGAPA
ncbi:MAG: ABC transporter substrate-binding protein [Alkalispirochaetaceae bacterium]